MKQQTALNWFLDQLPERIQIALINTSVDIVDQAKQMEKEQIIEAWNDGNFLGRNGNILADYSDGNGYYNKTYDK